MRREHLFSRIFVLEKAKYLFIFLIFNLPNFLLKVLIIVLNRYTVLSKSRMFLF
jgi:hypothetical protein